MRTLLVLACSKRKKIMKNAYAAVDVYDGIAYRMIRKQKREGIFPLNVDIMILSAKYGLIRPTFKINNYDLEMSTKRACELKTKVHSTLYKLLSGSQYTEIYIDLGRNYLAAIDGLHLPKEVSITFAEGRIGERLGRLKAWLSNQRKVQKQL